MKIRTGFVSNSSSSCFILDGSNPKVIELLKRISANLPDIFDRCTAMAVGENAIEFAKEQQRSAEDEDWCGSQMLSKAILKWADVIGEENVVFLRESDEGMGGYLFGSPHSYDVPPGGVVACWSDHENYKAVKELALEELEYH
jgi:hypothetical protein